MTLAGRDFMKLLDYSKEEIQDILNVAKRLKKEKKEAVRRYPHGEACAGKNIVLIFEKASTRTRCAFEVAAADLGVHSTMLDMSTSQMGKKESIEDTARVLSTMYDGIMYRGYSQEGMEEFARYSSVPVWNALSDRFHPTQLLADLLTIEERFGKLKGLKLCYMGDARFNMGNSYMVACSKMGMHFVACTKEGYFPEEDLISECQQIAEENGGSLRFTESVAEGCKDADIIPWESRRASSPRELRIYSLIRSMTLHFLMPRNPLFSFIAFLPSTMPERKSVLKFISSSVFPKWR